MTETETVKVCRKCGEPKPTAAEFYRETKGSRGREGRFRAVCKDCWLGKEPEVSDERREFIQKFVVNHLAEHGPTASLFFQHSLEHRNASEISKRSVERAINDLVLNRTIVSSDRLISDERVSVLSLP
jgi:hypothetical protein